MISSLDDQRFSSMQSTSELDDSRKELRQVECCVHGRPCAIASKLSREKEEKAGRYSSSRSQNLIDSDYSSIFEKSEPYVPEDISYDLRKKVEREALDVPARTWNFRAPRFSSSTASSERSKRVSEIEDVQLLGIRSKERHTGRMTEGVCLSRTIDAPSMRKVKKQIISKEKIEGYEMMRPSSVTPPPMSAEEALWTARTQGSKEVSPSIEAYLGVMSANEAEQCVLKPVSFKLYHMMPKIESLNSVLPSLGLYIIYRSGAGRVYHYPIRQRKQHADYSKTRSKLSMLTNLQVEYGDPMAPWFFTLDALVSYYNIYVNLREVDGEYIADIFPASGRQQRRKSYENASPVHH
uniref:SH2 domain-containing protein n=1 Tax=Elaeophora elaphi TaxID=1147741 RepID=A0A0R3S297_9BILA